MQRSWEAHTVLYLPLAFLEREHLTSNPQLLSQTWKPKTTFMHTLEYLKYQLNLSLLLLYLCCFWTTLSSNLWAQLDQPLVPNIPCTSHLEITFLSLTLYVSKMLMCGK